MSRRIHVCEQAARAGAKGPKSGSHRREGVEMVPDVHVDGLAGALARTSTRSRENIPVAPFSSTEARGDGTFVRGGVEEERRSVT